jgi:hypothetical protein
MPSRFPPDPHDWTFGWLQVREIRRDVLGYYTELQRGREPAANDLPQSGYIECASG